MPVELRCSGTFRVPPQLRCDACVFHMGSGTSPPRGAGVKASCTHTSMKTAAFMAQRKGRILVIPARSCIMWNPERKLEQLSVPVLIQCSRNVSIYFCNVEFAEINRFPAVLGISARKRKVKSTFPPSFFTNKDSNNPSHVAAGNKSSTNWGVWYIRKPRNDSLSSPT